MLVDEPNRLCFDDGFADEAFNPNPDMPVSKNEYRFEAFEGGTRATCTGTYASKAALEQVLYMGSIEGASSAINQIDGLLVAREATLSAGILVWQSATRASLSGS